MDRQEMVRQVTAEMVLQVTEEMVLQVMEETARLDTDRAGLRAGTRRSVPVPEA
jgi:hypothetical protein